MLGEITECVQRGHQLVYRILAIKQLGELLIDRLCGLSRKNGLGLGSHTRQIGIQRLQLASGRPQIPGVSPAPGLTGRGAGPLRSRQIGHPIQPRRDLNIHPASPTLRRRPIASARHASPDQIT
jgi:hypothetical protein